MGEILKRERVLKDESGYSLVGVLLLIVLISVLGLSLVAVTANSVKTTTSERSDQSAFYIAEAGATLEMAEIEETVQEVYNEVEKSKKVNDSEEETRSRFYAGLSSRIVTNAVKTSPADFEEVFGEKPRAEIEVREDEPGVYTLISTGFIGKKKRMVEREFSVNWQPKTGGKGIPKMAGFVRETITVKNGTITGDIGTIMKGARSIIIENGSGKIDGKIYVPLGSENVAISGDNSLNVVGKGFEFFPELPPFPEFPNFSLPLTDLTSGTVTITGSQKFGNIDVMNDTLFLDVGETDRDIVVSNISLHNGNIKLIGSGKLTIYVTGEINFNGGDNTINADRSPAQLNIFLEGSGNPLNPKTITLEGSTIHASLYAQDAKVTMNQNGTFKGNIFTGGDSFIFENGNTTAYGLFFAPNAEFEHNHGTIDGTVIAKSYRGEGILNYQDMQFINGPISVEGIAGISGQEEDVGPNVTKKALKER